MKKFKVFTENDLWEGMPFRVRLTFGQGTSGKILKMKDKKVEIELLPIFEDYGRFQTVTPELLLSSINSISQKNMQNRKKQTKFGDLRVGMHVKSDWNDFVIKKITPTTIYGSHFRECFWTADKQYPVQTILDCLNTIFLEEEYE